ncbi:hypothetical protein, partial [Vibrio cyclitrophicus]|uniref:hypothetical protein n=1 Tax=Vibrio cyclitrophicus TaxID=47951 RepID=UPI001F2B2C1D
MNNIYIIELTNALHASELLNTNSHVFSGKYKVNVLLTNKSINIEVEDKFVSSIRYGLFSAFYYCFKSRFTNDIVLFNTVSTRVTPLVYLLSLICSNYYIYGHNMNSWSKYINRNGRSFRYYFTSIISTLLKKRIIKGCDKFIVANSTLKEY